MTIDEAEKIKNVVKNKDYITQLVNVVAKTLIEAFENLKIEDVNMYQLGYNKAIDDFATKICEILEEYQTGFNMVSMANIWHFSREIAEQLKAGGENEY